MAVSYYFNEYQDIDQYVESVSSVMDIRSTQLTPGNLLIKNHVIEANDIVINYYATNLNLIDKFSIGKDRILFSLTSTLSEECSWCGIHVPKNAIGIIHSHREHDAFMPGGWVSVGINFPVEYVFDEGILSEEILFESKNPEKAIFSQKEKKIISFKKELVGIFAKQLSNNRTENDATLGNSFHLFFVDRLRELFSDDHNIEKNTLKIRMGKRYTTFKRAVDFIEDTLTEPFVMTELCSKVGVSSRTLQNCFSEYTGVTPFEYIMARKLNLIRYKLLKNDRKNNVITQTLNEYSISNAGRFASIYKEYFGQLPSQSTHKYVNVNPEDKTLGL